MLNEYHNGCSQPSTLAAYNKITNIHHIHSYSMYVDEDAGEVVEISFDMGRDTFHGQINPETNVVTLIIEFETTHTDGSKELVHDLYGYAELDNLITLLKKLPHINDVLIDMGDGTERVH